MTDLRHISSESFQAYQTPAHIFDPLNREFAFTLDAAASDKNAKCEYFFSEDDDALTREWHGRVWCNPPYADVNVWLHKALYEVQEAERAELVVMLLPASTSTRWFQTACKNAEVHFYKGRIAFDKPEGMVNNRRPGAGSILVIIRRGGPKSVTAFRSVKTGEVVT